jgi:hypothetical protein
VKLHLAPDPLAVKVCIPPPALILVGRVSVGAGRAGISPTGRHHRPPSPRLGPHKGDAEEAVLLLSGRDDRLPAGRGRVVVIITMPAGSRRGLLHDYGGRASVLVKGRVFLLVLCLPGVVNLKIGNTVFIMPRKIALSILIHQILTITKNNWFSYRLFWQNFWRKQTFTRIDYIIYVPEEYFTHFLYRC